MDVIHRADLKSVLLVLRVDLGGEKDHRNVARHRVCLQSAAHLVAVHARHHDVEQHDVGEPAIADVDGIGTVGGRDDVEIFGREACFEQLHVRKDIVDDEDAGSHDINFLTRVLMASR